MRIYYPKAADLPDKNAPVFRADQLRAIKSLVGTVKHGVTSPMTGMVYHSALLGAGMGSGKAQPLDSLVLTPSGFIRMGDVTVGTEVMIPSGGTAKVSGVFPQGERPVLKITLMDGRQILADEDHLWTVLDRNRHRSGYSAQVTTAQMLETHMHPWGSPRYSIQMIEPQDLGEWKSTLDPWVLGVLLGNGGLTTGSVKFSTGDMDTVERFRKLLPAGLSLVYHGNYDYTVRGEGGNPVLNELRRLGLMGHGSPEKWIPKELMHSSVDDRLRLIQGLLDADGSPTKAGFEFSSASKQLADDFIWLVQSLGGRATRSVEVVKVSGEPREYQRIYGRLPERFEPFLCERKAAGLTPATKYALTGIGVRKVERVGNMPTQCIMVDHPDHEYITDGFTRTHNTVITAETILQTQPERTLIVGVRDAFDQFDEAFRDQQTASGYVSGIKSGKYQHYQLRRIVNTKQGREALADLLAGEPGLFYVGLEMLRAADWKKVTHEAELQHYGELTWTAMEQSDVFKKMKPVDLIVSDEAHRHSNRETAGLATMRSIKADAKIALSGTFFGNKFENAYDLTVWLYGKAEIGSKEAWRKRWCATVPVMSKDGRTQLKTKWGQPITKVEGERDPGAFVKSLPCYVFIETPVGDPPEPEVVKIDLKPEQMRQYIEMEQQSLTWLDDVSGNRAPLIADLPLTQRIRLRTAALGGMTLVPSPDPENIPDKITFLPGSQSSTLDALHKVLHRPDWVGEKALILTHSKEFAVEAARRVGSKYTVALKVGGVTSKQWKEDKRRFMLPKEHPESLQYIIAVTSAVGTATDGLQRNCSRVVILSESDSNVENIQGANRIWRLGGDLENYHAVKIVQRGTVAEGILVKNREHKERTMKSVSKENDV